MDRVVYICTGTCGAKISEEQFKNGLTKCGTKSCNMYGHSFKQMIECGVCGKVYAPGEEHTH